MEILKAGVCAPLGFTANGIHSGIAKKKDKNDLGLILSDTMANCASVYTRNKVKGAPIFVTQNNTADGKALAIIVNSGNANTCNADGIFIAETSCELLASELKIAPSDIIIASTGVIGQPLSIEPFKTGIAPLVAGLSKDSTSLATSIMTTDTVPKEVAVSFTLGGKTCTIGGAAKGSGMIHPDMATMLVFITTDVAISSQMLQKALSTDVQSSFNMLSVDGDTSTNDMVSIMANGLAENTEITSEGEDFEAFMKALNTVTVALCRMVAGDGEGATKLVECTVTGAVDEINAKICAKSVICSSLVKTAIFGADANWGRILCALGYSGAHIDVTKVAVSFVSSAGEVCVCENGAGIEFSEEIAKEVLSEDEIEIKITLGDGSASAVAWGCDLTYEYVRINGDYRT